MPLDYTSNTFSEVYKDDYSDSAGFHRILFNSGRPLQARELTQLQTILQTQIQRFADNVFLDGAAVGSSGAGVQKAAYVILENLASGRNAKDYEGVTLVGPASTDTSGLRFHVVHAEEAGTGRERGRVDLGRRARRSRGVALQGDLGFADLEGPRARCLEGCDTLGQHRPVSRLAVPEHGHLARERPGDLHTQIVAGHAFFAPRLALMRWRARTSSVRSRSL